MKRTRWMMGIVIVAACGLIVAGCGGDEPSSDDIDSAIEQLESIDQEELEEAQQQAEEVLENLDSQEDLVELCKQGVEATGLEGDLKDTALEQCENTPDIGEINP